MNKFKNILCVMSCKATLERVVNFFENSQAHLTVVNFSEIIKPSDQQIENSSNHEQELESMVAPYRKRIRIQSKLLRGIPRKEIIREVMRNGHDLVIKSPECSILLNRFFCSTDRHLFRKCPCPVLLIRPTLSKSHQIILAAVDVNDVHPPKELQSRHALNKRVFEKASTLALSDCAELHIVYAWRAIGESAMRVGFNQTQEEKVFAYVEQLRRQQAANFEEFTRKMSSNVEQDTFNYLRRQTHLVKGCVHKAIPTLVKKIGADLLVMGTFARTGVSGFTMPNTAEIILNKIDCSLLTIKSPV